MSDHPEGSGGGHLTTLAGMTTAALAVGGAIWFGLLSLGAAIAYGPVGVEPREVGLDSSTVLSQSAVGLAILVVVVALAQLVVLGSKPVVTLFGRRPANAYRTVHPISYVIRTIVVFTLVGAVLLGIEAFRARADIRLGHRTHPVLPLGLASPWGGQIARVEWMDAQDAKARRLPRCVLYLGQADGTAIFFDAGLKRTWRMPTSAVVVIARPSRDRC